MTVFYNALDNATWSCSPAHLRVWSSYMAAWGMTDQQCTHAHPASVLASTTTPHGGRDYSDSRLGDLLRHHTCAYDLFNIFTARRSFGSSDLQRLITNLFSVLSSPRRLGSRIHAKAKRLFQLNIITACI
jgi:hypothetical protein